MGQDDEDFRREMAGVRPIRAPDRVPIRREDVSALAVAARRRSAAAVEAERNPLGLDAIERLDAWYPLSFCRPGVQHGVFRKLKQGRYTIDARLDLHRMTAEQARNEVFGFIREAHELDLRTLLIVHGRGLHHGGKPDGSVLKSYVNHWLPQFEEVQAFVSAQPQHGGVGAVYVMLKKSERSRLANRERFS